VTSLSRRAGECEMIVIVRRLAAVTVLLAGLAATAPGTQADQWITPTERGEVSLDGRVVVRVIPGESWGEAEGFKGAPTGKHAIARFYRLDQAGAAFAQYREQELLNPVAPVVFAVADDGALATLDNWHNAGYGPVLVVYAPTGEVVKSYELKDLYSEEQIAQFPISVSSIWWRCLPVVPAIEPNGALAFVDRLSQRVAVDLATGAVTFEPAPFPCAEE
jgi:hypothetical protein